MVGLAARVRPHLAILWHIRHLRQLPAAYVLTSRELRRVHEVLLEGNCRPWTGSTHAVIGVVGECRCDCFLTVSARALVVDQGLPTLKRHFIVDANSHRLLVVLRLRSEVWNV